MESRYDRTYWLESVAVHVVDSGLVIEAGKPGERRLVTWTFTLQPGEMRTLDLRFVVKYPKKKVIDGL